MRDGVADEWGRSSYWTGTLGKIAKKVNRNAKAKTWNEATAARVLHLGLFLRMGMSGPAFFQ